MRGGEILDKENFHCMLDNIDSAEERKWKTYLTKGQ